MKSLQQDVKSEDLSVFAQERSDVRRQILGGEVLIESAVLIVSWSFVSALLSNVNISAIIVSRRHPAYLRGFDLDLAGVAEEPDVYKSA